MAGCSYSVSERGQEPGGSGNLKRRRHGEYLDGIRRKQDGMAGSMMLRTGWGSYKLIY